MRIVLLSILHVCLLIIASPIHVLGQDAVLLNHTTSISIKNNTPIKEISYEILINNKIGEEYTSVSIPYNAQTKITDVNASITDFSGKTITKLKTSDIKKRSLITDAAFFVDAMLLEFSLQHYSFPYIFRYSYIEQASQFLYIDNWYPFITPNIETKNAELILQIPKEYQISINNTKIDAPVITETDKLKIFSWKSSFKALAKTDENAPDIDNFIPCISIVPKNFKYQSQGSFDTWKTYGQWQYDINKKLQELSPEENAEIRRLVADIPDTLQKIKTLYYRLQDRTRYVNISLKAGGMIPVAAYLVSENKYGDCKGLTNYFRAVLHCAGINSIYTDVNAGKSISPFYENFPSQQFNHVILCIPLKTDTVWLDCTSKGPFGYLGTFTQNRPVLLIENEKSSIARTPALTIGDVKTERNFVIRQDSAGTNLITANCTYRGDDFETLHYYSKLSDFKQQKLTGQYYGLRNTEADTYKISHIHRDETKINLSFTGKSDKYIQKVGKEILIKTIPFDIPNFRKPNQRNYPVNLDYPIYIEDNQIIEITTDVPKINPFADVNIETPYGLYQKTVKFRKNGIEISKKMILYSGYYKLDKYPDFHSFIEKIKENESNVIVIYELHE